MISRLTATATLLALLAAGSLAGAASARGFGLGAGREATPAATRAVQVVELPRVTIVARRLPADVR